MLTHRYNAVLPCKLGQKTAKIRGKLSQPRPEKEHKRVELEPIDPEFLAEVDETDRMQKEPLSEKDAIDFFNDEVARLKGRE